MLIIEFKICHNISLRYKVNIIRLSIVEPKSYRIIYIKNLNVSFSNPPWFYDRYKLATTKTSDKTPTHFSVVLFSINLNGLFGDLILITSITLKPCNNAVTPNHSGNNISTNLPTIINTPYIKQLPLGMKE